MFLSKRIYEILRGFGLMYFTDYLLELLLNLKIDHEKYGLKPEHRPLSAHATMSDALPNHILSGEIILKQNVERFTESGVIFENEKKEFFIDDVILATGYKIKYNFLSEDIIKVRETKMLILIHRKR